MGILFRKVFIIYKFYFNQRDMIVDLGTRSISERIENNKNFVIIIIII